MIGTKVKVYNTKTNDFIRETEIVEMDLKNRRLRLMFDFYYYDIETLRAFDNKTYIKLPGDYKEKLMNTVKESLETNLDKLPTKDLIQLQRIMNKSKSREGETWNQEM